MLQINTLSDDDDEEDHLEMSSRDLKDLKDPLRQEPKTVRKLKTSAKDFGATPGWLISFTVVCCLNFSSKPSISGSDDLQHFLSSNGLIGRATTIFHKDTAIGS